MVSPQGSSTAFERLLIKLRLSREPYRPDLRLFPEIDVARLKAELRLEEVGAERGAQGQPASTSATPDDVEIQIANLAQSEAKHTLDACYDQLRTYAERLNALAVSGWVVEITAASHNAVADFTAHTHQGLDDLHAARCRLIETEGNAKPFVASTSKPRASQNLNILGAVLGRHQYLVDEYGKESIDWPEHFV